MQEFKQCPNGHFYRGASCPYCKTGNQGSHSTSLRTEAFINGGDDRETVKGYSDSESPTLKTDIIDGGDTLVPEKASNNPHFSRTVFGETDTDIEDLPAAAKSSHTGPRFARKLVGWLVTYSLDELGVDYKLYEGRNIIGRDMDCNITVNDGRMSGKHAVLLFRANKYSLTDSQSSHGTFVNEEDIELEPHYLKDGDIIRMGKTVFKFRTSL